MSTVLYLDGMPLVLSGIKRNARDRVMSAYVENGDWLLKLGTTTAYAFEEFGTEQILRNEWPVEEYEEVVVPSGMGYNDTIAAADKVRNKEKST